MMYLLCEHVCVGREGGLGAAQRQVDDGGKRLGLIPLWKMPDVSRAVIHREFWPTLVLRHHTEDGSVGRKTRKLGSCQVPRGGGDMALER